MRQNQPLRCTSGSCSITFTLLFTLIVASGCQQGWKRSFGQVGLGQDRLTSSQKSDIQLAIGRSAESRGDHNAAMEAYQKAISNHRRSAEAHHRLAVLFDKLGRSAEADELYRRALVLAPESAEIHCNYGYSCYLQERLPLAEENLRRAIELRPSFPRARNNLGMVLARRGRIHEALNSFAAAGLTESQARANLAYAMVLDANVESAQQHLQLAKSTDHLKVQQEQLARFERALAGAIAKGDSAPTSVRMASYQESGVANEDPSIPRRLPNVQQ